MDSGFYAACAGLRAKTQALEIVANNVANLNSTGYRSHQAIFRTLLMGEKASSGSLNRVVNSFGVLGGRRLDLSGGNTEQTGNPFDMATEGDAFFAVQAAKQTLYTRNGNFHRSSTGELLSAQGDPVLGEQGPILVPSGQVSVGSDGTISVDGAIAGSSNWHRLAPVRTWRLWVPLTSLHGTLLRNLLRGLRCDRKCSKDQTQTRLQQWSA